MNNNLVKFNTNGGQKFTKLKVGDFVMLPMKFKDKYTPTAKEVKWTYKHFKKAYAWNILNSISKMIGTPIKITKIEIEDYDAYGEDDFGYVYTDLIIKNKISKEDEVFEFETSDVFIDDLVFLTEEEFRSKTIDLILDNE